MTATLTPIGGPTALLEYGGARFLTDPTFDGPGDYEPRPGVRLTKLEAPALAPEDIGAVDVVLLSHDQHADNLDASGRRFLQRVAHVLTTPSGAERLGATALAPGERFMARRDSGLEVTVTAVAAVHGPDGAEKVMGEVIGFVLRADGLPTVYVSGDNASLTVVEQVARSHGPIDVAVLFAGGARTASLPGFLTLSSAMAAEAAAILGAPVVIPLHHDGWAHFTEGRATLESAFAEAGLSDRLRLGEPGTPVAMEP